WLLDAGGGTGRGHVLADFLDALLDRAGTDDDLADLVGHLRVVADIALEDRSGCGENVVHRQGDLAADGLDGLAGRAPLLGLQQFERMQSGGDLMAEDFGELQVGLTEGARPRAFDVEGADDFVLENQRYGQRTVSARGAWEVERVGSGVGTQV